MSIVSPTEALDRVQKVFGEASIQIANSSVRQFPGEIIIVVEVFERDFEKAIKLANEADSLIPNGFVTIKKATENTGQTAKGRPTSLIDPRINDLIETLNARSRTSEQQPSLRYIPDAAQTLSVAASRRHHLIFGRRGVGKTALLLETKRLVEERGAATFWINIQTMRSLTANDAFLTMAARLCDVPEYIFSGRSKPPLSLQRAKELRQRISNISKALLNKKHQINLLLPEIQMFMQLLGKETQDDFYIFLDDMHYLALKQQPLFLDMVHSITRDTSAWIKVSGIRHQSRWFTDNPPIGLQTGHDAAIINLDVTLEQPAKAQQFLNNILRAYTDEAKLPSIAGVISRDALDRLVLASGGVPRDYLVLGATTIQVARQRVNAKSAKIQDVNEAAGQFAQVKLQELEDDAASSGGRAEAKKKLLNKLREFLLNIKQSTYFRVDFRDKEEKQNEYELLQGLMDLRLIHLINAGLSDEREAGRRSEVYMLDLSQFSGTRFKRNLKVLDFTKGYLVLKSTGGKKELRPGDTPKRLLSILRRAPQFQLSEITPLIP